MEEKCTYFAAKYLEGRVIDNWTVISKVNECGTYNNSTGGNFSVCYIVERDNKKAFMKVLDYEKILSINKGDPSMIMEYAFRLFNYEKQLSEYCSSKKLSKVIHCIDSGVVTLNGFIINGTVSYIIYEMGNGDVRRELLFNNNIQIKCQLELLIKKIQSLHDISVGIHQLHSNNISHLDIKPSNVLLFDSESKIGDLGSSHCYESGFVSPIGDKINADYIYMAPEYFFSDFQFSKLSSYQIDNYMLGGLIFFYLTGASFTSALNSYLPKEIRLGICKHDQLYSNVLPDMINAFQSSIHILEKTLPNIPVSKRIVALISCLCFPDPKKRGHPKCVADNNNYPIYDLQRVIQELDLIRRTIDLLIVKDRYDN